MNCLLKDIVDIQSWYFVRPECSWDIVYLQAKDFDEFWDLKWNLVPNLNSLNIQEKQILVDWDILFSAKWTRNFATVYKDTYGKCVASSTFFILKIKNENAIAEYLAILLTEASKWKYFKDNASWWYIQSISKPTLQNFEINLPSLEKQNDIIKLYELYKNETKIYEQLKSKKDTLINQIILQTNSK